MKDTGAATLLVVIFCCNLVTSLDISDIIPESNSSSTTIALVTNETNTTPTSALTTPTTPTSALTTPTTLTSALTTPTTPTSALTTPTTPTNALTTPTTEIQSTETVTWNTTAMTSLTTPDPDCGTCELGIPCNISCGSITLPPVNETGSVTSEIQAANSTYQYVEARLDARMLTVGESLHLTAIEPEDQKDHRVISAETNAARTTIVTCRSNMANNAFVFNAWSGRLKMTLMLDPTDRRQCKSSGAIRSIAVTSLDKPVNGGDVKDGDLQFPPDGQLPPLEGTEQEGIVEVTPGGRGFGVNITVHETKLDASLGDALYINPGSVRDAINSVLFSWTTDNKTKPRELRFLTSDAFYVYLRLGERPPNGSMDGIGFRLTYSNMEPVTPPPSTLPPTTPLPTAPTNVSDTAEVFVEGPSPANFLLQKNEFRDSIANMSNVFCLVENIEIWKPVVRENVLVYVISQCPLNWPNSANCTAVTFGVPVFTIEPEYELTQSNLERMWTTLASPSTLPQGMKPYTVPNSTFWWWIGVTFGILVLIILLIILVWRIDVYQNISSYNRSESLMGSGSSKLGSFSGANNRGIDTIAPHQIVPPYMMELDHEGKKSSNVYTDNEWGYDHRDSYLMDDGIINSAFHDDEDEFDLYSAEKLGKPDEFGSETDDEIVEAVGPSRADLGMHDLIYDTPSETNSVKHIKLDDMLDPNSETNL